MAKFKFNDFTTNHLQDSMILSSKRAFEVVKAMLAARITPLQATLLFAADDKDAVHFWLVEVSIEDQKLTIILPIFIPQNEDEAAAMLDKCYTYMQKEQCFYCQNQSFLLIAGKHYGQFFVDEHGNSEVKIFNLWASQKIVQEYFNWALHADVGAALVKLTFSTFGSKDRYCDAAWMISHDGDVMFLSIDACSLHIKIHMTDIEWQELETGTVFSLNGQKYKVSEDADNGQFLAKV